MKGLRSGVSDLLFTGPSWREDSPYDIPDNPCAEALAQANCEQEWRRRKLATLKRKRRTPKIDMDIRDLADLIIAVDQEILSATGLESPHG